MKIKNWLLGAAAAVGLFGIARAVGLSGLIINTAGLAYSNRYVFNLSNAAVNTVSATAVYSSATFSADTINSGQISTGSITMLSVPAMSTAAATFNITVATGGNYHDSIVITKREEPGAYVFLAGRDWLYQKTASATALSIATVISNNIPWLSISASGSIVYATAPVGGRYNTISLTTNNTNYLTLSNTTFTGGQDPLTVFVNGYGFQAGRDFQVGTTSNTATSNLSTAINARAGLNSMLTASVGAPSNIVKLQSKLANTIYNFPLTTSSATAATVFAPNMVGGLTPSITLNSAVISAPNHGLTRALPVLYAKGSAAQISGLVDQTTYYVIPVDANDISLAALSTQAVAGTNAIVLASSQTLTTQVTSTLTPLPWSAGTAGFAWQTSNDNVNWTNLAITSVTYTVPGTISWNLGTLNFTYLGLNVTGPTQGGLSLQVTAQGNQQY